MTSISRLIAGTAVVLAAVLTAAPVTAGVADCLINPGQQPTKRVSSQVATGTAMPASGTRILGDRRTDSEAEESDERAGSHGVDTGAEDGVLADAAAGAHGFAADAAAGANASIDDTEALVAETAADAETRVSALARDLQIGVDAGEFSQADAERVLSDISSYIRGERTWPERSVA